MKKLYCARGASILVILLLCISALALSSVFPLEKTAANESVVAKPLAAALTVSETSVVEAQWPVIIQATGAIAP